jgi:hypothetical protein
MCIFKSLTGNTGYANRNAHFNNNKIKGNEQLMLVTLNCTMLHDQNEGCTMPYPYLIVCCTNIYLRMLFKEPYIA